MPVKVIRRAFEVSQSMIRPGDKGGGSVRLLGQLKAKAMGGEVGDEELKRMLMEKN
jgi:hypothetical protein